MDDLGERSLKEKFAQPVVQLRQTMKSSIKKSNECQSFVQEKPSHSINGDSAPTVQQAAVGSAVVLETQDFDDRNTERRSSSRRVSFANTCQIQEFLHDPTLAWKSDKNKDGTSDTTEPESNHKDEIADEAVDPLSAGSNVTAVKAAGVEIHASVTDQGNLLTGQIHYVPLPSDNSNEDLQVAADNVFGKDEDKGGEEGLLVKKRPSRRTLKRKPLVDKHETLVDDNGVEVATDSSVMEITLNQTIGRFAVESPTPVGIKTLHFIDSEAQMELTCADSGDPIQPITSPKMSLTDVFKALCSSATSYLPQDDDVFETSQLDTTIVIRSAPSPNDDGDGNFVDATLDLENVSRNFANQSCLPVCSTSNALKSVNDWTKTSNGTKGNASNRLASDEYEPEVALPLLDQISSSIMNQPESQVQNIVDVSPSSIKKQKEKQEQQQLTASYIPCSRTKPFMPNNDNTMSKVSLIERSSMLHNQKDVIEQFVDEDILDAVQMSEAKLAEFQADPSFRDRKDHWSVLHSKSSATSQSQLDGDVVQLLPSYDSSDTKAQDILVSRRLLLDVDSSIQVPICDVQVPNSDFQLSFHNGNKVPIQDVDNNSIFSSIHDAQVSVQSATYPPIRVTSHIADGSIRKSIQEQNGFKVIPAQKSTPVEQEFQQVRESAIDVVAVLPEPSVCTTFPLEESFSNKPGTTKDNGRVIQVGVMSIVETSVEQEFQQVPESAIDVVAVLPEPLVCTSFPLEESFSNKPGATNDNESVIQDGVMSIVETSVHDVPACSNMPSPTTSIQTETSKPNEENISRKNVRERYGEQGDDVAMKNVVVEPPLKIQKYANFQSEEEHLRKPTARPTSFHSDKPSGCVIETGNAPILSIANTSRWNLEAMRGEMIDNQCLPEISMMDTSTFDLRTHETPQPSPEPIAAQKRPQKGVQESISFAKQGLQLMHMLGLHATSSSAVNKSSDERRQDLQEAAATASSSIDTNKMTTPPNEGPMAPFTMQSDEGIPGNLEPSPPCSDPCEAAGSVDDKVDLMVYDIEMQEMIRLSDYLIDDLETVCKTLDDMLEEIPTAEECTELERVTKTIEVKQRELKALEKQLKVAKKDRRAVKARADNLKGHVREAEAKKEQAVREKESIDSAPGLHLFMEYFVHKWSPSEIHVAFLEGQLHYRFTVEASQSSSQNSSSVVTTGNVQGVTIWCEPCVESVDSFAKFVLNYMLRSHDVVDLSKRCSSGGHNGVTEALQSMSLTAANARMLLGEINSIRCLNEVSVENDSVIVEFFNVDSNLEFKLTFLLAPRAYPDKPMPFTFELQYGTVEEKLVSDTVAKVKPGIGYLVRVVAEVNRAIT